MKTPLFISSSPQRLPNWFEAFPTCAFSSGLPSRFDKFDDALIFIDFMNLSRTEKMEWLDACLATERKVFVLSPTPDVKEAIEVIKRGAVGYGHTLSAANRLQEMALVVSRGGVWIGQKLMKRVMSALGQHFSPEPTRPASAIDRFAKLLSEREISVARLVALGSTNAEISTALEIKERTVKAHITSLFDKLGVRNRVELALLLNNVQIPSKSIENPSNRPAL